MDKLYYESLHKFCVQIIPCMDDDKDFDSAQNNAEQYISFARKMLERIESGESGSNSIAEFEAALTFFVETYFSKTLGVLYSTRYKVFRVFLSDFIVQPEIEQQLQRLGDER